MQLPETPISAPLPETPSTPEKSQPSSPVPIAWNGTGTSSSLMVHRSKFRKKTFKKSKRQCTLKYFRDAVTNVVTAL
jgi:hypothetical protein